MYVLPIMHTLTMCDKYMQTEAVTVITNKKNTFLLYLNHPFFYFGLIFFGPEDHFHKRTFLDRTPLA